MSLRAVIYADNGKNAPGAFVAASNQVSVAAGAGSGWVDFPFAAGGPTLPAGSYWVGYWFGSTVGVYYDNAGGAGRYVAAPYSASAAPPASFGSGAGSSIGLSLYAPLG